MIITEKKLDDVDKKILKLAGEGLLIKEMDIRVDDKSISVHTISIRIREMKRYYGCKTLAELVLKMNKM